MRDRASKEPGDTSEFVGPAFSADGMVLFVGIQSPGHVVAITGPWARPSNERA